MEKLYETHAHLVFGIIGLCVMLGFATWGVIAAVGFVGKLNWPSVSGEVVLCEQIDALSKDRKRHHKRETYETITYEFSVNGRSYKGESIEVLSKRKGWKRGARRVLIDKSSHAPVKVWYDPSDPNVNRIDKPGILEFPWGPWVGVIIALSAALTQFRERKTSQRLNSSIPDALKNAQLEALKRKVRRGASLAKGGATEKEMVRRMPKCGEQDNHDLDMLRTISIMQFTGGVTEAFPSLLNTPAIYDAASIQLVGFISYYEQVCRLHGKSVPSFHDLCSMMDGLRVKERSMNRKDFVPLPMDEIIGNFNVNMNLRSGTLADRARKYNLEPYRVLAMDIAGWIVMTLTEGRVPEAEKSECTRYFANLMIAEIAPMCCKH